jgi:hypothetical protein
MGVVNSTPPDDNGINMPEETKSIFLSKVFDIGFSFSLIVKQIDH